MHMVGPPHTIPTNLENTHTHTTLLNCLWVAWQMIPYIHLIVSGIHQSYNPSEKRRQQPPRLVLLSIHCRQLITNHSHSCILLLHRCYAIRSHSKLLFGACDASHGIVHVRIGYDKVRRWYITFVGGETEWHGVSVTCAGAPGRVFMPL